MRPRKHKLVLSLDNLRALMIPGKPYSAAMLSHIFNGSAEAIGGLLDGLAASGSIETALAECGRYKDQRETRRIFWVPADERTNVAMRRTGPAEVAGVLTGYDLTSFQRLAMASRR